MIYLDTHALVWIITGSDDKFSRSTQLALKKNKLLISPMVLLEIEFLYEIKRIKHGTERVMEVARKDFNIETCRTAFEEVVTAACLESWTRDPFDRVIVAQARINAAKLLSFDRAIMDHYLRTIQ